MTTTQRRRRRPHIMDHRPAGPRQPPDKRDEAYQSIFGRPSVAPPARQLVYPTPSPGQLLRRQTVIPEHLCPSAAGPVPAVLLVATPLPSIPPQHVYSSPVARRTHGSTLSHTVRGELPLQHGRRHRPQTRRSTRAESSENWSNTCPGSSGTS